MKGEIPQSVYLKTIEELKVHALGNRESIVRLEGRIDSINSNSTEIKSDVKDLSCKFDALFDNLDKRYANREEVEPMLRFYNTLRDKAIWGIIGILIAVIFYVILKDATFFINKI